MKGTNDTHERSLKRKNRGMKDVNKPKYVLQYNKGMGGVELHDQVLVSLIMRKFVKEYHELFFPNCTLHSIHTFQKIH